jgi:hypothetical protein
MHHYDQTEANAGAHPQSEDKPFLRAILDDEGGIRYRLKTRQRIGAKYLLREVFD